MISLSLLPEFEVNFTRKAISREIHLNSEFHMERVSNYQQQKMRK